MMLLNMLLERFCQQRGLVSCEKHYFCGFWLNSNVGHTFIVSSLHNALSYDCHCLVVSDKQQIKCK